ncbi:hypothetical protein F442_03189 [Phytophthora nicotianae P10297]|uniref:BZIP domain-containing protein n=3 Tax=Phytophthora nicotianae TaxID=4792 RepID=W2ZWM0_PHYNI|nr:hypothetical protein L915_03085 [Phytophthora nicotianae]ETP51712.1 hypothetical protein F442_03189 [Phytophthora nicotianae P10297]
MPEPSVASFPKFLRTTTMASFLSGEKSASATSPARPEDTAVLMRGGRGRGRRMRVISKSKLPRMNNSERGKFYRQKYREYEDQLDRDVQRLQDEVNELQRLLELRQILPHQYPRVSIDEVRAAIQVVYGGLIRLHERWVSESPTANLVAMDSDELRSAEHTLEQLQVYPSQSERFIAQHQNSSAPLVFKLESIKIQGSSDSRIVAAHGHLYVQYQPADLEMLFPVVRHNKHLAARLLAKEVAYDCTYHFHTSAPYRASELAFVSVDVDAVGGLLAMIPSLQCVQALLSPDCSGMMTEEVTAGSRINSTNRYERSPALLAAAIRAVDEQEYSSSPSPPRPMALAFILS